MPRVQLFQPFASDMRIDGRRRDVGVPEQQLHDAKIRPVIEQVRREGMPQGVRRQARSGDARLDRVTLDELPERLPRQWPAACRDEYRIALPIFCELGSPFRKITLEPIDRLFAERYQPLLVALAEDAHDAHIEAHLPEFEAHE